MQAIASIVANVEREFLGGEVESEVEAENEGSGEASTSGVAAQQIEEEEKEAKEDEDKEEEEQAEKGPVNGQDQAIIAEEKALSMASVPVDRHERLLSLVWVPVTLCLILYVNFFHWRANMDLDNPDAYEVVVRFFMQPNMAMHFMAAIGAYTLVSLFSKPTVLRLFPVF